MKIAINDQVRLSEFRSSDKDALIVHLNDRDIYERTLRIPFPYTAASADEWFTLVARITQQQGRPVHWAIRSAADTLIGGCGFDGFQVGKSHQAEVGYWLAKPFWGRGIMTAVVQRVWDGYLENERNQWFVMWMEDRGTPLHCCHTSGHASVPDLKWMRNAFSDAVAVPVHLANRERFSALINNVQLHGDGEWWEA